MERERLQRERREIARVREQEERRRREKEEEEEVIKGEE